MPELYEKIRDQYISAGKSEDEAQRIAAATYNKLRKRGVKGTRERLSNKPHRRGVK